jgi:2-polyprenyl-3-methyl-5-hydroxy-6-metoxy-1,4-benzoquinol methylase
MSDENSLKAQQASIMKSDWDARAQQDVYYFIATRDQPWSESSFFEQGRQEAHSLTLDSFRELVFDPRGKRMLEIGCGIGRLFTGFTEMFSDVWGVDVSTEMINMASKLNNSPNVIFMENNGYDLAGVPDNYFDFVFSYITFQHIPEVWMI